MADSPATIGTPGPWFPPSRSARPSTASPRTAGGAARQILGEVARRVVVSDRFPSYGWIELRQFCWAHLRRDFQAMIDRGGEAAEIGRSLLDHSNKLFHWWHRVRDGTMARSTLKGYTAPRRRSWRTAQMSRASPATRQNAPRSRMRPNEYGRDDGQRESPVKKEAEEQATR